MDGELGRRIECPDFVIGTSRAVKTAAAAVAMAASDSRFG
jgi:hypothetical protein